MDEIQITPIENGWLLYMPSKRSPASPFGLPMEQMKELIKAAKPDDELEKLREESSEPAKPSYEHLKRVGILYFETLLELTRYLQRELSDLYD